jgi:hypothetical protein
MGKVSRDDFNVRYEGENIFRVFKHPQDMVGVVVRVPLGSEESWDEDDLKDIAVWAWNSALEERGHNA